MTNKKFAMNIENEHPAGRHNASRRRSTPAVKSKELQALRVQTWYRHVLERAVGREVGRYADIAARRDTFGTEERLPGLNTALQKWLNSLTQHNLSEEQVEAVQRLGRRHYDLGETTPTEITLTVFETLLPGSAAVYDLGPGELPVWRVLDGDMTACQEFVQEMLNPTKERWEDDFAGLVQEVMDSLIAPAYRVKLDDIPILTGPQRDVHPVWLTHINNRYAVTFAEDEADKLPEAFTLDDSILLAIALANLATEKDGSPQLQLEWLLVGLCWGVIAEQIDEHVQEYVLRSVQKRGKVIDAALKRMGLKMPTFEERWPAGLAP
ncbi:hypothetical protein [Variovorax sp. N23]|uniref:hypothetical protein n=1 Tax=Variovorax sp. N23 TaxID=2980555 RepID=UPI0021C694BE|nr:hypothetical protein [Variovorax sp. N23]